MKHRSKKDNKKLNFKSLCDIVMKSVDMFLTTLMTDDFKCYKPFKDIIPHHTVNRSCKEYVNGIAHTDAIASFWAIFKKGIKEQFHFVSLKYPSRFWMSSAGASTTKIVNSCLRNY